MRTRPFQKVQLFSNHCTEYLPKSLGDNQDILWQIWDEPFWDFLVSSDFCLWTLPWMVFLPSLFLIVESWTLTLTEASVACSSLDVVLSSFITSWMRLRWLILVMFGHFDRPATSGKFHHCSKFSPFVDNGSARGSQESQSLRNGFIIVMLGSWTNIYFEPVLRK